MAIIGMLVITIPLVRIGSLFDRINTADSADTVVTSLYGIAGGLAQGFFGLMVLGFLCDGGKGFKPLWLLLSMTAIGALWLTTYPGGWILGVPLCLYSGEKIFRIYSSKNRSNNSIDENGEPASPVRK